MCNVSIQEFSEEPTYKKRRLCQYYGPEPSVEEIEGEFWRIVETPDEVGKPRACLSTFLRSCAAESCMLWSNKDRAVQVHLTRPLASLVIWSHS